MSNGRLRYQELRIWDSLRGASGICFTPFMGGNHTFFYSWCNTSSLATYQYKFGKKHENRKQICKRMHFFHIKEQTTNKDKQNYVHKWRKNNNNTYNIFDEWIAMSISNRFFEKAYIVTKKVPCDVIQKS